MLILNRQQNNDAERASLREVWPLPDRVIRTVHIREVSVLWSVCKEKFGQLCY